MTVKRIIIAVFAILVLAQIAPAQTTGTATVTGTNPAAVSITSTADASLSTTVALGNLLPTTGGTLTAGTFQIRMRSSKAYVLSASATALNFNGLGSTDGGDTIAATDIGFGITALANTGVNVADSGARTDAIVAAFSYTGGYPAVTNGLSPFVGATKATLNDISTNTQILSGSRISTKGNISTDNNFILATIGIATLPQYFTPNTDFSAVITLTVTVP
jgi:hypothetical protein